MVGKNLSHYKILEELGRGGMGIVYKAEDTKLDRTVAIKVLPSAALASENDRARFYREAKAAAQLHHPHIASVFEIDEAVPEGSTDDDLRPFIAMEYIEGETLDAKIKEGPLKLEDAVRIGSEIASALEAAHKKDIVHRDIKSQNIMLTEEGAAKVLDFGLAQTAQSTKLTSMGSTLGTIAYMSPEQARSEVVDLRTDIWSLGVVLYEMISGKHPFPGDYEQAAVYSILNEDPEPLTALRTGVPMGVEWIVSKCLAKKAEDRYQTATDLLVDLRNVDLSTTGMSRVSRAKSGPVSRASLPDEAASPVSIQSKPTLAAITRMAWPLIAVAVVITLGIGYLAFSGGLQVVSQVRLQKLPIFLDGITNVSNPTVSPNSDYLAFSAEDTLARSGIFLFHAKTAQVTFVDGSDGGISPLFSPGGTQIAFSMRGGVYLSTIPTGNPSPVIERGFALTWENDTSILYYDASVLGTMRFDLASSEISPVALPDTSSGDPYAYFVTEVISESHLAIGSRQLINSANPSLLTVDLDSGTIRSREAGIFLPRYVSSGFLVYQFGGRYGPVMLRPFDSMSGDFTGPPMNLLPEIWRDGYSVSVDGSLVYVVESLGQQNVTQLFLLNLSDKSAVPIDRDKSEQSWPGRPAFSPNGKSIVLHFEDDNGSPFVVSEYDLESKIFMSRTFGDSRRDPDWSSDGSFIYFDGRNSQSQGIYKQAVDITGEEILVVDGNVGNPNLSPDGKWLAFHRDADIYLYDFESGTESVVDSSAGNNWHPDFSPDSRYLAYETNTSGTWQVAVRPIDGAAYSPLDHAGARRPKWAPDGKSLYFIVSNDGIYTVPVTSTPFFQILGDAEKIVSISGTLGNQWFDISPDGKTLAITANSVDVDVRVVQKNYSTIMWWQNWAQSLSKD